MDEINKYVWYLIAASAAAVPIPLIKTYLNDNNNIWIISAIVSYLILVWAYVIVLQDNKISTIYPILKVLSVILVVISGKLIYDEQIQLREYIGILFGIIAIYLLQVA
jgi:multidrug transporter EmrE-like cation transporter